jgi:hypothetical protein
MYFLQKQGFIQGLVTFAGPEDGCRMPEFFTLPDLHNQ